MRNIFFCSVLFLSGVPLIASAAIDSTIIGGYSRGIINIINYYLVPALLALAFLVFLWGVFKQFIWKGDSGEAHTEGAKFVATGLIGFVIILSLWALVNIARVTLGVDKTDNRPETPKF
jgi:hypothetical protein